MAYYTYIHKRVVPSGIRFKIILGNFYTTFGLIFLILSFIFFIVFASFIKIDSLNKNSPVTEGIVTGVDVTNTTVNDQRVYAYHYEYKRPDGSLHRGKSFSNDTYYEVGSPVKYCTRRKSREYHA